MKHKLHKDRKSFKKWGLTNQRTQPATTIQHVMATTNKAKNGSFALKLPGWLLSQLFKKGQ